MLWYPVDSSEQGNILLWKHRFICIIIFCPPGNVFGWHILYSIDDVSELLADGQTAHVYFSPLSVDSRPIGRPTRSQPTVDRLSADCRLTVGQWVSPTIFQYHLKNETGPRFRGGADSNTGLLTGFGSKPFQMPHWKVRERLRCGETYVSSVSQLCRRRRIYTL